MPNALAALGVIHSPALCRTLVCAIAGATPIAGVISRTAHGGGAATAAAFQGLGDLPGGAFSSRANAVSGDGSVVVGLGTIDAGAMMAFRWTATGGMVGLGHLPGPATYSEANGVSANGLVVVGEADIAASPYQSQPFQWTSDGGMVGLAHVPPGDGNDHRSGGALAASADGEFIVGYCDVRPPGIPEEFVGTLWIAAAAPIDLEATVGGAWIQFAWDISADGLTIVGNGAPAGPDDEHAVRWTAKGGPLFLQWIPGLGRTTFFTSVSADGAVAAGAGHNSDFNLEAIRWTASGGFAPLGTLPGATRSYAAAISGGGGTIVGFSEFPRRAFIWNAGDGMRDLKEVLTAELGLDLTGWTLAEARGVSDDGLTIVGLGTNPAGDAEAWVARLPDPNADTDGDGLLDDWEINGIPYLDVDGEEQRYVISFDGDTESDLDPMRRDLLIEVDSMTGLGLPAAAEVTVEQAFDFAPLENPDGSSGITLRIVVDDTGIPFDDVSIALPGFFPFVADDLKDEWFGTPAERADPSRAALLVAKAKAYRYCLVLNRSSESGVGGRAELPGDDMILFAGALGGPINVASAFMHEFGHNLGLHHGGGDDVNGKPNYPSVMNYMLAYKKPWNETFWRLDYSREDLPALDEAALDEEVPVGVPYYFNFRMPYYAVVADGAPCFPPDMHGQPLVSYLSLDPESVADFNLDCDEFDLVAGDINYLQGSALPGAVLPSPDELLAGWNDWQHVVLAVSSGGGAFSGVVAPDELTEEQVATMDALFPTPRDACAADLDGSGDVGFGDLLAVLSAWGACANIAACVGDVAPDVGDGEVGFADLLEILADWGACGE
jgi:probable HAF family extracellular repeat protein